MDDPDEDLDQGEPQGDPPKPENQEGEENGSQAEEANSQEEWNWNTEIKESLEEELFSQKSMYENLSAL